MVALDIGADVKRPQGIRVTGARALEQSGRHCMTESAGAKIPIERIEVSVYTVPTDLPESDGAPSPVKGELRPDLSRPGMGLEFKRADAARFQV